jgi:hypothetical protein
LSASHHGAAIPIFGEHEREVALARALELLRADPRVEAGVLTSSLGAQSMDRWSDLDIDAVIAAGESTEQIASDWVSLVYREWPVVHDYETNFGSSIVRRFLLDNGRVLAFGFDPVEDFTVWAPSVSCSTRRDPPRSSRKHREHRKLGRRRPIGVANPDAKPRRRPLHVEPHCGDRGCHGSLPG